MLAVLLVWQLYVNKKCGRHAGSAAGLAAVRSIKSVGGTQVAHLLYFCIANTSLPGVLLHTLLAAS